MSEVHLFQSPKLGNEPKGQLQKENIFSQRVCENNARKNFDQRKLEEKVKRHTENYRTIMSVSKLKVRDALRSAQMYFSPRKEVRTNRERKSSAIQQIWEKELSRKKLIQRKQGQQAPHLFISGSINFEVNPEEGQARLTIHKLKNQNKHKFDALSCLVIATDENIDHKDIFLPQDKYDIIISKLLPENIFLRKVYKVLEVQGSWFKSEKPFYYVILRNEQTDQVVCVNQLENILPQFIPSKKVIENIF